MKLILVISLLFAASLSFAEENGAETLFAQTTQFNSESAPPRVMPLYEQGWNEGAPVGDSKSGKLGWFGLGLVGNVPFIWLPWIVEPRRPAKPPVHAEEEYNSGFKNGYRAGWKNAHKGFYIAGAIVSTAAAATIVATQE